MIVYNTKTKIEDKFSSICNTDQSIRKDIIKYYYKLLTSKFSCF